MRRALVLVVMLSPVLVVGQLPAVSDTSADPVEQNRRLIEKLRAEPERYERLKRDLKAFLALPADRQARLRQLDQALHASDPEEQERLWQIMDRYVTWLERLPEKDRRPVDEAPDPTSRLKVVKEVLENQWIDRLPRAKRDQLAGVTGDKRATLIARFKEEEKTRRAEWNKALWSADSGYRKGPIVRAADLPEDARRFVEKELLPAMSPEDRDKLKELEGRWPAYPRMLISMAEKYPIVPPPPVTGPITKYPELPDSIKRQLGQYFKDPKKWPQGAKMMEDSGRWPDYAIGVTEFMRSKNISMPQELGPCRPREFTPEVRKFIEEKLIFELNSSERAALDKAEGKWPEYPRALFELTRKHNLPIPGLPLPGSRDFWDKLRVAVTDVSDRKLMEFARELTRQEREGLQLPMYDPNQSRERLKQEFFKRYPGELFGGWDRRKGRMGPGGPMPGPGPGGPGPR